MVEEDGQTRTKRVAILIEDGVEDSEFTVPHTALKKAGAEVIVLGSRMNQEYKGKQGKVSVRPDGTTTEARAETFDAVIIPGGMAPDKMRTNAKTVRFVQQAMASDKLVAAVCHGPQVLIEGDLLRGRTATGFIAIRKDMENAGAHYVDEPLVIDGNLITSRRPGDLPIFTATILTRLGLNIPDTTLPDQSDRNAGWWKLAEEWNGSSKRAIVEAINTAIAGERYGLEAFEQYAQKVLDPGLNPAFKTILENKQHHLQLLEARLEILGERESFQASASGTFANLKNWLKSSRSDDLSILRQALGDLQTGVVDTYALRNQLTDPATTAIFDEMEVRLAQDEQRIADLYQARIEGDQIKPPQPTTGAAVG